MDTTKAKKLAAIYKQFLEEVKKAERKYNEKIKTIFKRIEQEKLEKLRAKIK